MLTIKRLTVALLMLVSACGPNPDMPMYRQTASADRPVIQDNPRVKVTRIGVFKDDLAYESKRGVYLITDSATGKEYFGISGIGITEVGSHYVSTGKSGYYQQDER